MLQTRQVLLFALSLMVPALILFYLPFGLAFNQGVVLAGVLMVVFWWASSIVHRSIASAVLLLIFLLFGDVPVQTVFNFPLSPLVLLIIGALLIGEGIARSNLAARIARQLLERWGYTPARLVVLAFILGIILIFFIPHPFPRVIILTTIYIQFLVNAGIPASKRKIILFSIYVASTSTVTIFLTGDILLNYAILEIGNISMTWFEWAYYMTVPSIFINVLMCLLFLGIFRKDLRQIELPSPEKNQSRPPLTLSEKKAAGILASVMLLWMTEPIHSVDPAYVSLLGLAAMLVTGLLDLHSFKKINIHLLIFLTAAFAIGGVMSETGVAEVMYRHLFVFSPDPGSLYYYAFIVLVVMFLHMFLGSAITTIAIVLPPLMSTPDGVNEIVMVLMVYTATITHYLLPFHHATIMLGTGENHFDEASVLKYGIGLTITTFISTLFIQLPWWRLIGLL